MKKKATTKNKQPIKIDRNIMINSIMLIGDKNKLIAEIDLKMSLDEYISRTLFLDRIEISNILDLEYNIKKEVSYSGYDFQYLISTKKLNNSPVQIVKFK